MRWILFLNLYLVSFSGISQNLRFNLTSGETPIYVNTPYFLEGLEDKVVIEKFKFYISDVYLMQNADTIYTSAPYYLIDLEDPSSLNISLPKGKYSAIHFNLGVDSIKNSTGAHGGVLDPMNGMYWSWQSGYINFKLEGRSSKSLSADNTFTYHLGGYSDEDNALIPVNIPLIKTKKKEDLNLYVSIDELFQVIDISSDSDVMSPGTKAVKLSKRVGALFKVKN